MIDVKNIAEKPRLPRKRVNIEDWTENGQVCVTRGIIEAERRWCESTGEENELMDGNESGAESNATDDSLFAYPLDELPCLDDNSQQTSRSACALSTSSVSLHDREQFRSWANGNS